MKIGLTKIQGNLYNLSSHAILGRKEVIQMLRVTMCLGSSKSVDVIKSI